MLGIERSDDKAIVVKSVLSLIQERSDIFSVRPPLPAGINLQDKEPSSEIKYNPVVTLLRQQ